MHSHAYALFGISKRAPGLLHRSGPGGRPPWLSGSHHLRPAMGRRCIKCRHPSACALRYTRLYLLLSTCRWRWALNDATAHGYDASGVFGAIFRELEWKTQIFPWRAVPKTPNASYPRPAPRGGGFVKPGYEAVERAFHRHLAEGIEGGAQARLRDELTMACFAQQAAQQASTAQQTAKPDCPAQQTASTALLKLKPTAPRGLTGGRSRRSSAAGPAASAWWTSGPSRRTAGRTSPGRYSHFHAALYISLGILGTKQTGGHESYFTAHG